MPYDRNLIVQSDPYKRDINTEKAVRNIYWGEVISIEDETDGGRIKVRIPDLDTKTLNENLPWCYPMLPKFFHLYPQVGEVVRIYLEDVKYPQRSRFWMGSIISQLQKIGNDPMYTALSTTNIQFSNPLPAISTYPDAKGVFPEKSDIALIGRDNTDIILRVRDVEIRAGKNEVNNVYSLNKQNPASVRATYDVTGETTTSSTILMGDKIALISHDGIPKFKAVDIDQNERQKIFNEGHPLGRGDTIVQALELMRRAIIEHVHPYSGLPSDPSGAILDLEKADFTKILQNNIVIN